MKKIINTPDTIVNQVLNGFVSANSHRLKRLEGEDVIAVKEKPQGKVGVAIGNGAGHEPNCIGFVGKNMVDANAVGGIFACPGPFTILEAIKEADNGKGVCLLISNHEGDVLNSKMAIEMAHDDGITVEPVIFYDDISTAPREHVEERRGTISSVFVYKMVGSYAAKGHSLSEVVAFGKKVVNAATALTVALAPGISPINGEKMFELADDEIEVGVGCHGESGTKAIKMCTSAELAKLMVTSLIEDLPYQKGDEISVIVNGCGGTTYMELLLFYNDIKNVLDDAGINVYKPIVGNFSTTQEMAGVSLGFCKLDDEMKEAWDMPTDAAAFPTI